METRLLSVPLSDSEWRERAARMARKRSELDRVTEEKKARMAGYKSRLDEIQADISKLARAVETQAEDRDVPIEVKVDTATRMRRVIRLDTNELVEERALTLEEMGETPEQRQAKMPWADDGDEPLDEAADAPAGAPKVALLVHADHWEAATPEAQKRITALVERFDLSFAPVDGIYRSSPLTVGGRGLAGFEHLCRELGVPCERGDVVEAVDEAPADDADEDEDDEATAELLTALEQKITTAPDLATLEQVWAEVETARGGLLDDDQIADLEVAWEARKAAVPDRAEPQPVKKPRGAKKGGADHG
jgi:hypothetical protein